MSVKYKKVFELTLESGKTATIDINSIWERSFISKIVNANGEPIGITFGFDEGSTYIIKVESMADNTLWTDTDGVLSWYNKFVRP